MNHRWLPRGEHTTLSLLILLGVTVAACGPPPAPQRPPQPAPRVAPPPRPRDGGVSVTYGELIRAMPPPETETAAVEEPKIGEAVEPGALPEQPAVEVGTKELPDESLAPQIKSAKAPNIAAALRLVEEGRVLMNQGRYDQSLDLLERSVSIDPSSFYGYYYLARLHFATKDYSQAVAFANRATALGAHSERIWLARAYTLQGVVFEEVGRFSDARSAYQRAVNTDPSNMVAADGRARLTPKPVQVEPSRAYEDPWR
jgi:Tfp pilus assembly protein PilF